MKNRETLDLTKPIGWLSTGYDHFRHVYEFIKALYDAIETKHVDYDNRERTSISKDNFVIKQEHLKKMLIDLSTNTEDIEITISATKTYPDFNTVTSIQRELIEVMKHANSHYNYIQKIEKKINDNNEYYIINEKRETSLNNIKNIIQDIEKDITRYNSIPIEKIPKNIQDEFKNINNRNFLLSHHTNNDSILFNNTFTSVSNEYYKIEEEIVHLLYDIRLHLEEHDNEYFEHLITYDREFWIARSTLSSS